MDLSRRRLFRGTAPADTASLPRPPFSEEDTESLAGRVYDFVWQRTSAGAPFTPAAAAANAHPKAATCGAMPGDRPWRKGRRIGQAAACHLPHRLPLLANAKRGDEIPIALDVLLLEIVEQATALRGAEIGAEAGFGHHIVGKL